MTATKISKSKKLKYNYNKRFLGVFICEEDSVRRYKIRISTRSYWDYWFKFTGAAFYSNHFHNHPSLDSLSSDGQVSESWK
jgi:hypothetical protein